MSTVGRMDSAFFVSRSELMGWANSSFCLSLSRIEQCANGAVYCQVIDACHPDCVDMNKVVWDAEDNRAMLGNYKVLQKAFTQAGIQKPIKDNKLILGRFQDNLEMLQWIKAYHERNCSREYDARSHRFGNLPHWAQSHESTRATDSEGTDSLTDGGRTLLKLEPDDTLHFSKNPAQSQPTRVLKLTNASNGHVAFKVKTTAPKSYLVRPSSGTVRPGESQEVQIILQPQGGDGAASNHRFLVQAVVASSAEAVSREKWAEYPKEQVQEARLNVVVEERGAEEAAPAAKETSSGYSAGNSSSGANDTPTDLKVKYDELVQYTLMLEKEKKKLEDDLNVQKSHRGGGSAEGYSKMTLLIVALIVFLLSYCAKFIPEMA